ncbi:MAG TPA: cold shock domain-containing protein [Verrucomicrobiae bacterium]|jgi:CspA family cold shock protein|nr:cold shock domain-containing protein [Verrucomicrobiae bacterium]
MTGKVKWYNSQKGYGFISVAAAHGAEDVFVHAKDVRAAGRVTLNQGEQVSFDTEPTERAHVKAVRLLVTPAA